MKINYLQLSGRESLFFNKDVKTILGVTTVYKKMYKQTRLYLDSFKY